MPRATPMTLEDRRAALVSATEPLLERYGRDVSTRQIAEAAGVAEGTIFRAFATKDELIDTVVDEVFDEGPTREALVGIDPGLPLTERLLVATTILQERMRRVFALFHALRLRPGWAGQGQGRHSHDEAQERHQRDRLALDQALLCVVGDDADQLRVSPLEAVTVLRAAVFALSHPLLGDERLSDPHRIVDLVLHGVVRGKESRC